MEAQNSSVSINLKPNKPQVFTGNRDFLIVNTWLYKMEQYFNLIQLANASVNLSDANRISYATTLLTDTAAICWYTLLKTGSGPQTWDEFTAAIRKEFVPEDHERRARDALRSCKQTGSVSEYLSSFRNFVLTIPDMSSSEKWDKFVSGLNSQIQFEVRKANCQEFEEATKIAMRIEAAFSGISFPNPSTSGSQLSTPPSGSAPASMEIGNTQLSTSVRSKQCLMDIRNNACFKCHKVGCRPWKHRNGNRAVQASVANIEAALASEEHGHSVDSDSSEN